MVSLRNLVILGITVMGAMAAPAPIDAARSVQEARTPPPGHPPAPGRFTIFHDPHTYKAFFTMGASIPQNILSAISAGVAGPAKALYEQFKDFVVHSNQHVEVADILDNLYDTNHADTRAGGIYGIYTDFVGDYGVGVVLGGHDGTANNLQSFIDALKDWASQNGAEVSVVESATIGAIDIGKMGAGQKRAVLEDRARSNQCPANIPNLLNYGDRPPPGENDWMKNFRFAGTCEE